MIPNNNNQYPYDYRYGYTGGQTIEPITPTNTNNDNNKPS